MKKFLCVFLTVILLCSLCGCAGGEANTNEDDNATQFKAEKGATSLTYAVSENRIESLLTFYETQPSADQKMNVQGKIYRNYAENIVLIDNREEFTPINFTCTIEDGEYQIVMQYGVNKTKKASFDGNGILQISIGGFMESIGAYGFLYDIGAFVDISENDTLAETITLNAEDVDFTQTIKNENNSKVVVEVSEENIDIMKTLKKAILNNDYAQMYPDSTCYVNDAKNIIIFDGGTKDSKPSLDIKVGKNDDGKDVFLITIKYGDKTYNKEHKGSGVLSIYLNDGSYMATYSSATPSTDIYTK